MIQYRIEETIDGNGVSTFRVQEKILGWWIMKSYIRFGSKEEAEKHIRFMQTKEVKYHTVEQ
jgi:hypothetical protein